MFETSPDSNSPFQPMQTWEVLLISLFSRILLPINHLHPVLRLLRWKTSSMLFLPRKPSVEFNFCKPLCFHSSLVSFKNIVFVIYPFFFLLLWGEQWSITTFYILTLKCRPPMLHFKCLWEWKSYDELGKFVSVVGKIVSPNPQTISISLQPVYKLPYIVKDILQMWFSTLRWELS